jgi:SAM-dependent MidA family methyltransferase
MNAVNLPTPDPKAKSFSDQLLAKISHEISTHGPITFARFMQMALYSPGLGYYSGGAQKFGSQGDFITAPEISPLFSQCIARQCQQVLADFAEGDILELGAGNGLMALTILKTLEKNQQLLQHYFILEVSAELQQRQQELFAKEIPHLLTKIQWLTALPTKPITGVILANEVMDAMPLHKFKMDHGVKEFFVDVKDNALVWHLDQPSSIELTQRVQALEQPLAEGYTSEINLMLPAWITSLSSCLQQGLILLIDYGFPRHEYYHPDRHMGTLMCHYQHHAHDNPLLWPGLQDITAHVDFTTVAEAADAAQLSVQGYTTQAAFLLNGGLLMQAAIADDAFEQYRLAQVIKRLTSPNEMGELFKAMALTRHYSEPLLGFSQHNQLERLSCRVWSH